MKSNDQNGESKKEQAPLKLEPHETALNDLRVEMMILRDLNAQLAQSTFETKTKSEAHWREQMKKEGVYEDVLSTLNRFKALMGDMDARRHFLEDITARVDKGDRVAINFIMGVYWPSMHAAKSTAFIRQMSLVYLVAQFENYVQRILSLSFDKHPSAIERKAISFGELTSFGDIEVARKAVSEKEASDRINEGIDKLAEYLSALWKVKLNEYERWALFRERFYRRNIIIHDAGRPNRIYREKTGYKGSEAALGVDEQYLASSLQMFDEVATLLCAQLKS